MNWLIAITAIVAIGSAFQACSPNPDNEEVDDSLVGTWTAKDDDWSLTFKADGTGVLIVEGDRETFEWEKKGSTLSLYFGDEVEKFTYKISGKTLKLTDEDGDTYTFVKGAASSSDVDVEDGLVGTWTNKSEGVTITFRSNGTGVLIEEGDRETFEWETKGNRLYMYFGDEGEIWNYKLSGSRLTISWGGDESLTFIRS